MAASLEIVETRVMRVSVTCTMPNRRSAMDFIADNGYKMVRHGPLDKGDGTVDHSVFRVIAEKEVA